MGQQLPSSPVNDHLKELGSFGPLKRSRVMSRLLDYLVKQSLAGRGETVSQYLIGSELLGFGGGFDPETNPIVRVQVGRLRGALRDYYAGPGSGQPIRFTIPQGSYALRIEHNETKPPKPKPRIAALPCLALVEFRGIGLRDPWDLFPAVFAEELSVALGRMPDLRILGPLARARLEARNLDPECLTSQYPCDYVLDGSIQRNGANGVLRVRLLDALTGVQIWSGKYHFGGDIQCNLAGFESELMGRLAHEIGAEFGVLPQHHSSLARVGNAAKPTVYGAVLLGRRYLLDLTIESLRRALKALNEAVVLYPDEAMPHATLAMLLASVGYEPRWRGVIPRQEITRLATRARKLDPDCPWAINALAMAAILECRDDQIEQLARQMMGDLKMPAILGGSMGLWMVYRKVLREDGLEWIERACADNPHFPTVLRLGPCLKSVEEGDHVTALLELDGYGISHGWCDPLLRAAIFAMQGNARKARRYWKITLGKDPGISKYGLARAGLFWHEDYLARIRESLEAAGIIVVKSPRDCPFF